MSVEKLQLQLKNIKFFLLLLGTIFIFSSGWSLILQQDISTEEAMAEAKRKNASYSVGRVNIQSQERSNTSTRIASFIKKDKALVILGKNESAASITCEFGEEFITTPVSKVRLVKDYHVCQLVLCILENPLEKIKPFATPLVPDVIKRLESSGSPSSEFIHFEAYCLGYGPNLKHGDLDYDNNYELKVGTIGLIIRANPISEKRHKSEFLNKCSFGELGEFFKFPFTDSKERQGEPICDTHCTCLIGAEDVGCPLFCYRENRPPDLIGIGFLSETERSFSRRLVQESEQWFICLSGILNELKIAQNVDVMEEEREEKGAGMSSSVQGIKRKREAIKKQADQPPRNKNKGKEKISIYSENSARSSVISRTASDKEESEDLSTPTKMDSYSEDAVLSAVVPIKRSSVGVNNRGKDAGASSKKTVSLPHGLFTLTFSDGTISKCAYNGWFSYQKPGAPELWQYRRPFCCISPPQQEWYEYSDGTKEKFDIDGTMTQCFMSGIKCTRQPNGTITYDYPHSVRRTYYPNEKVQEFFPNGWICITDRDKSEEWIYNPDYEIQQEVERSYKYIDFTEKISSDGSIAQIYGDGRVVVRHAANYLLHNP